MSNPKVSVVVPIRNEEGYISKCLSSLLNQTYPRQSFEIIVADGRSSDSSQSIVEAFCREHPNVHYLDNPGATAPCGMNIGIRHAQGEIIVRADGHNIYPADYLENCVKYLEQTGADNVGGPWLTVPVNDSLGARMVAAILTSPFGVGDSKFRISSVEGYVETVPFGAFRRELFERVGMYNEKLVRNQDNELNARIREAGGKIYQTPALQTEYHPVAGFRKLLKVTFKTSQWHLFSISENGHAMSARHLIPAFFVLSMFCLLVSSFFSPLAFAAFMLTLVLYLLAGFGVSTVRSWEQGPAIVCLLPIACLLFHISYGAGTLVGIRYLFKSPSTQPIREGLPTA
jgi:glycosyltransferase involved in cell wall biosynthesis